MGLTVHYGIKLKDPEASAADAAKAVRAMRQLALDLPFAEVGEIVEVSGAACDYEARRQELQGRQDGLFGLLTGAAGHVRCP